MKDNSFAKAQAAYEARQPPEYEPNSKDLWKDAVSEDITELGYEDWMEQQESYMLDYLISKSGYEDNDY